MIDSLVIQSQNLEVRFTPVVRYIFIIIIIDNYGDIEIEIGLFLLTR